MDMSKTLQPRSALLFSKADRFELNLCQLLNRTGRYTSVRLFFKAISRLGDGVFWYTLALAMPLTMGARGLEDGVSSGSSLPLWRARLRPSSRG